MFEEFLFEIRKVLPLRITFIKWNDPTLTLLGEGWSFNSSVEWRCCDNFKLIKACYDNNSIEFIESLTGCEIMAVDCQSGPPVIDPVFFLSNKTKLQFFSTSYLEPWIFKLPNGKIYIASPTDPKWAYNFSIEE